MSGAYLVTGASGFVGRCLVDRLLSETEQVVAVGRQPAWVAASRGKHPGLMVREGDLADAAFVQSLWSEHGPFRGVYHLAAQIPAGLRGLARDHDWSVYVRNNALVTAHLLDGAARQQPGIAFVYASTISVFGRVDRLPIDETHPTCPADRYGVTKLMGEECVQFAANQGEVRAAILRFPGMIGIGNDYGAVHLYTEFCLSGRPVSVYGSGQPRKDYIAVDDVVDACVLAMARTDEFVCEVFNVGGCQPGVAPAPLVELARCVVAAFGSGVVGTNDARPAEPVSMYFDNQKANRLLGYSPPPLADRIADYVTKRKAACEAIPVSSN